MLGTDLIAAECIVRATSSSLGRSEPPALDDRVRFGTNNCAGLTIAIANLSYESAAPEQTRFGLSKVPNLPNNLALGIPSRRVNRPHAEICGEMFERPESLFGKPRHDAEQHPNVGGHRDQRDSKEEDEEHGLLPLQSISRAAGLYAVGIAVKASARRLPSNLVVVWAG